MLDAAARRCQENNQRGQGEDHRHVVLPADFLRIFGLHGHLGVDSDEDDASGSEEYDYDDDDDEVGDVEDDDEDDESGSGSSSGSE